jgi:hypothetical protein
MFAEDFRTRHGYEVEMQADSDGLCGQSCPASGADSDVGRQTLERRDSAPPDEENGIWLE